MGMLYRGWRKKIVRYDLTYRKFDIAYFDNISDVSMQCPAPAISLLLPSDNNVQRVSIAKKNEEETENEKA